jgi:hypothetical protein
MRARPSLALVVALGFALSGCGGGGDDGPAATLPPVTPTASPTEAAADVPEEAREETPEGAAAFGRFFYETLEEAYAASDPDLLQPLVAPECEACQRILASLTRLRDEGLNVTGHTITVTDAVAPGLQPGETETSVTSILDFAEYVETDAQGNEVFREEAASQVVQDVGLRRDGNAWVVTSLVES